MTSDNTVESTKACCGCGVLIFNLLLGGWSVHYLISLLGKDIPFIADMLIGLFIAELSVPTACVLFILKYFGVF